MATRENDRKQTAKEEIAETEKEPIAEPSLNNEEPFLKIQTSTKNTLDHLDRLIQSSSKKSSKKVYLELFRAIIEENARFSESLIYLFEYVIDLRASILLLSAELEKVNGKTTKDVERLKSKLDSLLNSPTMVEIGKILQNIQRISEERKKQTDKKPAMQYLR